MTEFLAEALEKELESGINELVSDLCLNERVGVK